MKRQANKAVFLGGTVLASFVVHLVGETLGTVWQISAATLLILLFVAGAALVTIARVRDFSQNMSPVKGRVAKLHKRVETQSAAIAKMQPAVREHRQTTRDGQREIRKTLGQLRKSHSELDAKMVNLTQVATQLAMEMDFLNEFLRRPSPNHAHQDTGGPRER